jgi:hypothetical protein
MKIRALTLTALAGAAVAVSACGSGGGGTGTSGSAKDPQQAALEFAQCMREHGVDMPDPTSGPNGMMNQKIQIKGSPGQLDKAEQACRKYREAAAPNLTPEQQTELRDQAVRFAQCMREHGVDMPDPEISSGGGVVMRMKKRSGTGIKGDSPAFEAAQKACERYQPKPPNGAKVR